MSRLTEEQLQAFKLIKDGHNCVILGQAGTGKSVLVREASARLREMGKNVAVTASTGIASRQFHDGRTIHHWAGLSDGRYENTQLLQLFQTDSWEAARQRIRNTDILFIDEISMLSQRVFEQVALCFEIHM